VHEAALIGRVPEREAIAAALRALPASPGMVVAVEGEPGIGKSRLLDHLVASAGPCTVLGARASEFESDLPYALWTEALDGDLPGGDPAHGDRHRTHRALRELLGSLAAPHPLVLWTDDVQWADPASVEALAALVRRPPAAPVMFALAAREGQLPAALGAALAAADREHRLTALRLAPLSEAEAAELV
jgi:predicted ATPase